MDMTNTAEKIDKSKRGQRFDYPRTIEYVLDQASDHSVHKAVTINISEQGLGAYVFTPHKQGQRIIIRSEMPIDRQIATIQWIKKEDNSFFMTGLKFLEQ
jgi:hypothetical protein